MHDLCEFLSGLAGLASILLAAMGFSIQRDRRAEQSSKASSERDFDEMYDRMEKKKISKAYFDNWSEWHREKCRAALITAEASRWEDACPCWMVATGCAFAAAVMLYLLYMRVV
jgi:hypothetical protein